MTVCNKKLSSRHSLTGHTYKNSTVSSAPLTTPPAPMHSFSTFISDNRGGSNSSSKQSSPQHTASLGSSNSTDYGYTQGSVPTPPASKPPAMKRQGSYGSQFSRWVIKVSRLVKDETLLNISITSWWRLQDHSNSGKQQQPQYYIKTKYFPTVNIYI